MKKKLLAWFLSGAMILSSFPIQTLAEETPTETNTQIIESQTGTETSEPEIGAEIIEPQIAKVQSNSIGVQVGDFTVIGGALGTDYSYEKNTLTIKTGTVNTISGATTEDHIVVAEGVTANVTLAGVDIDVSSISDACAFEVLGTANITLEDGTINTLKSGSHKAGLKVQESATVQIGGTGTLNATGGLSGAGIGGDDNGNGGIITITGGTVNATGGKYGAGIGGGYGGDGGNLTITGGSIIATGGTYGAGIGGGDEGIGGNISITGGTVIATGGERGAGIGGGYSGDGGNISITGGTVTATGGERGAGIGGGYGGDGGNLTITGGFIIATGGLYAAGSIQDQSKKNNWKGIIFENGEGVVYGDQTLSQDLTIEENQTLTIIPSVRLTIPTDKTLTNSGTLTCNGILTGDGTLEGDGRFITNLFEESYTANIDDQEYLGDPIEPEVTISREVMGKQFVVNLDDWDKSYEDNNRVGTAKIIFEKDGVIISKNFEIIPYIGDLEVVNGTEGTDYIYIGNTLKILSSKEITIKNIDPSTPSTDRVVVAENVTANITLAGLNIDSSNISGYCAFDVLGTANITLADGITNTLKSGYYKASLQVQTGASVQIDGTGTLNAISSYWSDAAGIGGGRDGAGGNITINGGIINAMGSRGGAGIGGGSYEGVAHGHGGNITINGGTVTATGEYSAAGIGGGSQGDGGNITITGGTVTATCGTNAAAIGSGMYAVNDNCQIIISGGIVNVIDNGGHWAIGGGWRDGWEKSGTFSTGEKGTAIIRITSTNSSYIHDETGKASWQCILFEDNKGTVYGDQTLSDDLTIEDDETLTINPSSSLTINSDKTLTNSGTLTCNGTLQGEGTLTGEGQFLTDVFTADDITDIPDQDYTGEEIQPTVTISGREIMEVIFNLNEEGWTKEYVNNKDIGTATVKFTKGDVTVSKTFKIVQNEIISIDITWGTMSFSYNDGTWNTETHQYENGAWVCDNGSNEITVANNGSNSENVSLSYSSGTGFNYISGNFTGENSESVTTILVDVEEIKKFYLALTGKPTEEFEEQTIGTVTVTIGGNND